MSGLSDEQLSEIEQTLGFPLPEDVRATYRVSNGLAGPTRCQVLYPFDAEGTSGIIQANALRKQDWFPPAFHSVILLGDDGCGSLIGYDWNTKEAILWNPADGDWVQERHPTVTEMWDHIHALYEEPEGQTTGG